MNNQMIANELLKVAESLISRSKRDTINGIRVLIVDEADYAYDPMKRSLVSINDAYTRGGKRNPRGIRWEFGKYRQDREDVTKSDEVWLKGAYIQI
tara:strand:- start:322 stop:609 length:288 start_codon:yes stop_codon:yes gene_type:complete